MEVEVELVPEDAPLQVVLAVNALLESLVLLLLPVVADHSLVPPSVKVEDVPEADFEHRDGSMVLDKRS